MSILSKYDHPPVPLVKDKAAERLLIALCHNAAKRASLEHWVTFLVCCGVDESRARNIVRRALP